MIKEAFVSAPVRLLGKGRWMPRRRAYMKPTEAVSLSPGMQQEDPAEALWQYRWQLLTHCSSINYIRDLTADRPKADTPKRQGKTGTR